MNNSSAREQIGGIPPKAAAGAKLLTPKLELSQRRMRSPWREPRRCAGRRARPQAEALRKQRGLRRASAPNADEWRGLRTLVCAADTGWMRLSVLRSPRLI